MRHVKALGIKFLITAVILYSLLTIFETATLMEILFISLLVTGTAYVIGDLIILPRYGNLIATIADFGLAFAAIWILSAIFIYGATPIATVSAFCAFFIAISEALFHIYMNEKVLKKEEDRRDTYTFSDRRLQTEFSEEEDVDYIRKKNRKRH
ncbi:YndM family protein [Oceanobacillus salinisoli]|uniref:YndM family protein n=1 Tax=Oceanobacillus salinisoli TaxID=2678611 RepID=UPI0012E0F0B6|nr:YndM family protein [Oceanobacillus salinisoli]